MNPPDPIADSVETETAAIEAMSAAQTAIDGLLAFMAKEHPQMSIPLLLGVRVKDARQRLREVLEGPATCSRRK
jgi:hypothetical protein